MTLPTVSAAVATEPIDTFEQVRGHLMEHGLGKYVHQMRALSSSEETLRLWHASGGMQMTRVEGRNAAAATAAAAAQSATTPGRTPSNAAWRWHHDLVRFGRHHSQSLRTERPIHPG